MNKRVGRKPTRKKLRLAKIVLRLFQFVLGKLVLWTINTSNTVAKKIYYNL